MGWTLRGGQRISVSRLSLNESVGIVTPGRPQGRRWISYLPSRQPCDVVCQGDACPPPHASPICSRCTGHMILPWRPRFSNAAPSARRRPPTISFRASGPRPRRHPWKLSLIAVAVRKSGGLRCNYVGASRHRPRAPLPNLEPLPAPSAALLRLRPHPLQASSVAVPHLSARVSRRPRHGRPQHEVARGP